MLQNEVDVLKNQLSVARSEINKLRQQVRALQHVQRKDIDEIKRLVVDFRCEGCRQTAEENSRNSNELPASQVISQQELDKNTAAAGGGVPMRPIGIIRTVFPEKRAVPRQPTVGGRLRGTVELNSDVFTNPEHSLDGLEEFSHMWLLYHFHKNNAHPKAKVAPPRLGGERVGVFSTRSPHRPCPIGLSLVEIEKVEGSIITFLGTDMVSGTPVLDIKPYIPIYDMPPPANDSGRLSVESNSGTTEPATTAAATTTTTLPTDFYTSRQEPDGEESEIELLGAMALNAAAANNKKPSTGNGDASSTATNGLPADPNGGDNQQSHAKTTTPSNNVNNYGVPGSAVRVPNWIGAGSRLRVLFNERAQTQLAELQVNRQGIVDVLEADPRSVYLRTKYGSQIFTFQLSEVTVTCKFDDRASTVTVVQVRRTENVQDEQVVEQ